MNPPRVVIIGGGPAGMMAALFAARGGAEAVLLERNEKLGKKLYITGKGRCNLTNTATPGEFLQNVVRNPRFLYSALDALDNTKLMALIENAGTPLKIERGGRVFPVSDHASDVTKALIGEMARSGVQIRLGTGVSQLALSEGRIAGVELDDGSLLGAQAVVVATGGLSYPSTGSTGDGLRFARGAGHVVHEPLPALVPLETEESWPRGAMGISLKNVRLTAENRGKRIFSDQGELMLTHFGLSGPLALTLSSLLPEEAAGVRLYIDLKPALDVETLDARLLRDFSQAPRKGLISALDGLAPHSLALIIAELAGLSPTKPIHSVTQAERKALIQMIKGMPLTVKGLRGFQEAVITRGGVDVKQVSPSTMQSRLIEGLFFAGEVLDLDALTGGFNLQIAFSTGALAGMSAAELSLR
jgi:predicted Rossmann fold flavoprotein